MKVQEIAGFPGYLVSDEGKVLSCLYNFGMRESYRELRPSHDAKGYPGLTLCGPENIRRKVRVHRLVAEAFIPNPMLLPCVRHIDGNSSNPRADNLQWGTYRENEQDKRAHGTYEARRNGKLTLEDRNLARGLCGEGWSQSAVADLMGVSRPTITRLLNGATWGPI